MNDFLNPQIGAESLEDHIDPINRERKLGLVHAFIRLAKEGLMDREEVAARIAQLKGNNFITDEDEVTLTRELDENLEITPEQNRERKLGLVHAFIQLAKEGLMDREEVAARIAQLKGNNFITDEDAATLTRELDEALSGITE